jgi:haloalkane dehalogenase
MAMSLPAKKTAQIRGLGMAYIDVGAGSPIVFLHGNPTSSWLWRNILPGLSKQSRCIAPDLIGMGDSDPLSDPDGYSFATHAEHFADFMTQLDLSEPVTLVLHDWGSGLGFDWARANPESVKAIAYMEAIVRPLSWDEWPAASRDLFQALRSPAGEALILEKNIFVERILPASVQRELSAAEMAEYRRPFSAAGNARKPTLAWPRALPIDNEPADVCARVQAYADWMGTNDLPKLFINAEPGAILVGAQREFCRGWKNQTEVSVPGIHFIQEDSAPEISAALADWVNSL